MPAAEVEVTPALARRLVEGQFSDLAGLDLWAGVNGWDNVTYRLGPKLAVRLPRREASAALIDHEVRWLPQLAAQLPIPVPVALRVGQPTELYRWRWAIVPWFTGEPVDANPLVNPASVAADLGAFLAAMHTPAPVDYPPNPYRGVPLETRRETTEARMVVLDGQPELRRAVQSVWTAALEAAPWEGAPMWIHGDLHPANIIIDGATLAAVIDFGDLTAGDPATDLLAGFALFDVEHRAIFRRTAASSHRVIDDAMWKRARGWAITHGLAVLANSADNATMHAIGLRTLIGATQQ